jgi:hypothetical protein
LSAVLVRFARRLANWEQLLPVEQLQEREFRTRDGGPDLRPSVYEVSLSGEELVRAYAEHAAGIDPPRTALGIDVTEPARERKVEPTPGSPSFTFIRERHREIELRDVGELHAFIGDLIARTPIVGIR